MTFANIPVELRAYYQWVCWKFVFRAIGEKPTKVPYNPHNGAHASVTDPTTWADFDTCIRAVDAGHYDGIGFVFTRNDPYCGIDLDETDPERPEDFERQRQIYEYLNSYSEYSPSGKGIHIIVRATVPNGRKRSNIEIYSQDRYFTFTGSVFRGEAVQDRQAEVSEIWSQMGASATPTAFTGDDVQRDDDKTIYDRAAAATNGELFVRLWNGDWSGYPPNSLGTASSEADFALVDIIGFYTKNRDQIRRMFLASALGKRDKYRRINLIDYMINKSFDRALPDVDLSAVLDKINAAVLRDHGPAIASDAAGVESVPPPPIQNPASAVLPSPGIPLAYDPSNAAPAYAYAAPGADEYTYDGFDLTLWKREPPAGLVGAIARFIFDAAPRPVYEIALVGALGMMAGIVGRAYNVSNTGLNLYLNLLANTGVGKEAIDRGISRLLDTVATRVLVAHEVMGPGRISSGQALLKHLADRAQPCFVSVIGEVGLFMQRISAENANEADKTLRSVLLDLYNKSGAGDSVKPTIYSDKANNVKQVFAPAVTIVGESVPSEFYRGFTEQTVRSGLLPRFLNVEYSGDRMYLNEACVNARPSDVLTRDLETLILLVHDRMQHNYVIEVPFADDDAWNLSRRMDRYGTDKMNANKGALVSDLWNRYHIKVLKVAAILAVGVNPYQPTISSDQLIWASSLVMSDIIAVGRKYERGQIGENNEVTEQETAIKTAVREYFERSVESLKGYNLDYNIHQSRILTKRYLHMRCTKLACFKTDRRGALGAFNATLKQMIDTGILSEVPRQQMQSQFGYKGQSFVVNDTYWAFT